MSTFIITWLGTTCVIYQLLLPAVIVFIEAYLDYHASGD